MKSLDRSTEGRPGPEAGQILGEAAIGVSLMVFAWIIITYSLFLANYQIRTAIAARHAAWSKGESGNDSTPASIETKFFFDTGLTKVENMTPIDIAGLFSDSQNSTGKFKNRGDGPFRVKVKFGIAQSEINSTTKFPFNMMKIRPPMMPEAVTMDKFLSVETPCQWERVGDTWNDWGSAIKGLFDEIVNQAGGALSKLL